MMMPITGCVIVLPHKVEREGVSLRDAIPALQSDLSRGSWRLVQVCKCSHVPSGSESRYEVGTDTEVSLRGNV